MKKDLIFAPILLVIGVLLGLLKVTGMTAHIVLSVVGAIALVAYTVLTTKSWKIPALEIGMRVSYGLALISGIVLKIKYIAIIGVFHKIFAVLFVVVLVVLFIHKLITRKNK
jgi:phosphatidylserine synthase